MSRIMKPAGGHHRCCTFLIFHYKYKLWATWGRILSLCSFSSHTVLFSICNCVCATVQICSHSTHTHTNTHSPAEQYHCSGEILTGQPFDLDLSLVSAFMASSACRASFLIWQHTLGPRVTINFTFNCQQVLITGITAALNVGFLLIFLPVKKVNRSREINITRPSTEISFGVQNLFFITCKYGAEVKEETE